MATTRKKKATVISDVAKPGKSEPSGNSKSIIITHRPVMKDPMMVEESPASSSSVVEVPLPASTTVVKKTDLLKPSVTAAELAVEMAAAEAQAEPAPGENEPLISAPKPVTSSFDPSDTTSNAKLSPEDSEAALQKQADRVTELEKLVDSRKYYLPINLAEKRKNKRYVIIGVICIVVLGLAWLDVALDAGIVTISGVKAPTHFFSR